MSEGGRPVIRYSMAGGVRARALDRLLATVALPKQLRVAAALPFCFYHARDVSLPVCSCCYTIRACVVIIGFLLDSDAMRVFSQNCVDTFLGPGDVFRQIDLARGVLGVGPSANPYHEPTF